MSASFYFYDLETSGLSPRSDRIMQFAGQRTDENFQPLGEPQNILVQLADDTLPSPGAIMVTGITPQSTQMDGMSEREFCQYFTSEIATPGTTILGYNSVRFDDEFIRHALWRNFYDPYTWQWDEGRSRWDLLDVVRLVRALRPEGIKWPVASEGYATNRLELITKLNGIEHEHAHDALADVVALIEVTKLIKEKQPQMFDFLYNLRSKKAVTNLVDPAHPKPFVYASGRYSSKYEKTTVAYPMAPGENGTVWVFDLRYNLDDLLVGENAAREAGTIDFQKPWAERDPWERHYLPIVKKLQYNRCPAVAPVGVLEKADGWQKLQLDKETVEKNLRSLLKHPEFVERMTAGTRSEFPPAEDPESALYDGFLNDQDRLLCMAVRNNGVEDLTNFSPHFSDERLPELLLHYKAKNFPESLLADDREEWDNYRAERLKRQSSKFFAELKNIQKSLNEGKPWGSRSLDDCKFLAEELMLWYQSIAPGEY